MNKSKYSLVIIFLVLISTLSLSQKVFGEIAENNSNTISQESIAVNSYEKEGSKYSFKYPSTWKVYEIPNMSYLRAENIDANTLNYLPKEAPKDYFKIEVITLPSKGLSLKDWIQKQNTTSYPLPKVISQENIEVAGQPAIYQVEQFGSFIHPVIFISREENIYIINISSIDEKFRSQVDSFIKNFQFN